MIAPVALGQVQPLFLVGVLVLGEVDDLGEDVPLGPQLKNLTRVQVGDD